MEEKLEYKGKTEFQNKRNEIVPKCRHENKINAGEETHDAKRPIEELRSKRMGLLLIWES